MTYECTGERIENEGEGVAADLEIGLESEPERASWFAPRGHARGGAEEEPGFGDLLTLWISLTLVIAAGLWLTGFARSGLVDAVEAGAARVEWRAVGEVSDDVIRKAVRLQHDTLTFWSMVTFLGQFLGEPILLTTRALAVATAFCATAALMGRPIGYGRTVRACVAAQGFWVLGLAVHAGLMMALRRNDVATSAVLALPPGSYPAWLWLMVDQLDVFALIGWTALALGGVRRGQVGLIGAFFVCTLFWGAEAILRVGLGALVGSAMRLSLLPA